jgi:hypothetical protein
MLCTFDTCIPGVGCEHTLSDSPCDDGIECTSDTCDPATDTCSHAPCDAACDNSDLCTGIERCDVTKGCVPGPPACDLGLSCSVDTCDPSSQTCGHALGPGCPPPLRLLVCDGNGNLVSVSPFGGPSVTIASSNGPAWFDVAILGGRWFVIDGAGTLDELFPMTNQVKASFHVPAANSLGAGPDGFLYEAGSEVYRIHPNTGIASLVGSLPSGYASSGDVAFFGGQIFVSTDGPCGGALVQVDPTTGASSVLGGDGLGCVYGLASTGGTLFVVNCDGKVGTFDPQTGAVRVLSTTGIAAYGADVLP